MATGGNVAWMLTGAAWPSGNPDRDAMLALQHPANQLVLFSDHILASLLPVWVTVVKHRSGTHTAHGLFFPQRESKQREWTRLAGVDSEFSQVWCEKTNKDTLSNQSIVLQMMLRLLIPFQISVFHYIITKSRWFLMIRGNVRLLLYE